MNYERKIKFSGEEMDFHNHYSRPYCGLQRGENRRIKRRTNKKIRRSGAQRNGA